MRETITLQDGTQVQVADFELGFTFDSKALVEEQDDGTLIIEGYAADFDVDRQDEAFEPNAFQKALDDYMNNPVMLYHHKYDTALGKFTDLKLDGKGLWARGEVPRPPESSPVRTYYDQIKQGILRGWSVGGKFYRRMTQNGPKIFKADLREISVTPMPVNSRTLFAVAGKAFETMEENVKSEPQAPDNNPELVALMERLDKLGTTFDEIEHSRLEGKASQHPDGPNVAALQYHLQAIHTLAINTKNGSKDEKVQSTAADIAKTTEDHLKKVHNVAKHVGPLPNTYGGTYL